MVTEFEVCPYLRDKRLLDLLRFKDVYKKGCFNWSQDFKFSYLNKTYDGGNYIGIIKWIGEKIYCTCTSNNNEVIKIKKTAYFFNTGFVFEYMNNEIIFFKRLIYSHPIYLRMFFITDFSLISENNKSKLKLIKKGQYMYEFYYNDKKISTFVQDYSLKQENMHVIINQVDSDKYECENEKILNYIYGFASYLFISFKRKIFSYD